ncbi:MAG: uracil-DNA glycosylase [Candidatus Coatesbacteria bacterium]|nr:uracil-DNA glycosylase [Candidatus Coatesbacteria bacterium]
MLRSLMKELHGVMAEVISLLRFQAQLGVDGYPKEILSALPKGARPLEEIEKDALRCEQCRLCETRNKVVFGAGDPNANLMLVGEAPGAEEDKQGVPFVGRAGVLLTKILKSIQFEREEVYIANVLKCRPPENRDPIPAEVEACEPFLIEQIATIKPKIICALGAHAARTLLKLGPSTSIGSLRGIIHNYQGVPLIATYHPAYLLRSPDKKRDTWEDVKFLRRLYERTMEQENS